MIAGLECLPCLVRQAREMALMTTEDTGEQKTILRRCLAFIAETDIDRSPPEIMHGIGELITSITGVRDPYREIKSLHTDAALELLPEMERIIEEARDPFIAGLKLAIAGNIIDLGARDSVSGDDIVHTLREAVHEPLRGTDPMKLKAAVQSSSKILYLADNAGETVFDRKFLEQFPAGGVTVAVRGAPALNDATLEDARSAGLHRVADLMDNGSGAPATVLSDCSEEFRRIFNEADMIIAKGQGNYESLSNCEAGIHFLFRVKCRLVEEQCGHPLGSLVLLHSRESAD